MSKHTPGPWIWERRFSDGKHVATLLVTEHRPVEHNDPCVLAVREDWMTEHVEADGRLIACAPELLEAAKYAVTEWRLHRSLIDSYRILETAIAKAEGRR